MVRLRVWVVGVDSHAAILLGEARFLIAAFLIFVLEAHVQSNPLDFIVQDTVSYVMSAETELAFVLTATEEESNKAKVNSGISGAYGLRLCGNSSRGDDRSDVRDAMCSVA